MSLSKKLMLTFLGLTLVVLLATLSLARWSFERGFLEYANALEQQRLSNIAQNLTTLYIDNDGWEHISCLTIKQYLSASFQPKSTIKTANQAYNFSHHQAHEHLTQHPPHAPLVHEQEEQHKNAATSATTVESSLKPLHQKPFKQRHTSPTALFNAQDQFIAGTVPRTPKKQWVKVYIKVDKQIVGTLVTNAKRRINSPQGTAFSKRQWLMSMLIGLVALGLSVGVSLLLTRVFLAPIQRMLKRVSSMSNGDYLTRLSPTHHDELGQLMGDLDRLALHLQQNQSVRQRWIASISHELRTPVTVLTGEINAIKDGVRPLNMAQIDSVHQEVERLAHLIDDLYQLSLSDIGGLRYHFEPIDIIDCINHCCHKAQLQAQQQGLTLTQQLSGSVMINGDRDRLQQLLTNIINNSLKYTDAPGTIVINTTVMSSYVQIIIQDSLPGIPVQECQKLLEPLYRNEVSRSRHRGGAGLGLAICRNIAEAHQGTIRICPSTLGGIQVEINLPIVI
ncbi:ATP-binding protein [Shewanella intestini]|uniref:histidine kinase n=1 Tax=Shewanella intestini TaxID=2017544 RepID=A0ABS5I3F3_9GAMM|nr:MULTISPECIES: ATP-binding protein [Shewanella]MBR9728554.1 HAMP domain-containing protein [Shewanella intestini]MRG36373.1 HAMP domain-containing protein [Shewanella sp. XMDDZSB0408]